LGLVLFGFNSTATNLAFGAIADDHPEVSESVVSWVASGFFIGSAAFLPLGGRLGDRLGRRYVFNLGLVGFCITALAAALAPSIWVLIAARAGQAVASALIIPSSLAMALPDFPQSKRSSAVATWAAAAPLSGALAPSAAAALLQVGSWRLVYFVSAPAAMIALAASFRYVRPSKPEQTSGRLDLVGTVLAVASIGLLVAGISQSNQWGIRSPLTLGTVAASVVVGVLFIRRSTSHPTPLLNLSLFGIPQVAVANVANLFMSTTSLSIWLVWPLWLSRVWGYSPGQVGLAVTVGPACAGLSTLAGGRLADRYGQRWLMIVGSAIATGAVVYSYFSLGAEPNYVTELMPTIMCFGLGWGMSNPSMNSWALSQVADAVYAEVNATFNTVRNLGAAIGISAAIAIVGSADRADVLAAYDRANLFFATSIGLSCLAVTIGTAWIARRGV
jgi:MFS family permease